MTVYTLKDLEAVEGVQPEIVKKRLRINCFSGTFVRDRDFPMRFREEALKVLASYLDSGIKSFIVQSSLYLTLWREEKQSVEIQESHSTTATSQINNALLTNQLNGTTTQKVIKKYRGQEYIVEVEVAIPQMKNITIDASEVEASTSIDTTSAPRQTVVKKYRGQEYIIEI